MELPVEVAFRFEIPPVQIVAGVAVTEVGAAGVAFTETVTIVLEELEQPAGLSASA